LSTGAIERRHGEQEGVGRLHGGGRLQIALVDGRGDDHVQVGFDDLGLAAVDGVDRILVDIDADDVLLAGREHCSGWETNVTQTDHRDSIKGAAHVFLLKS